jgi:hypothetical protein
MFLCFHDFMRTTIDLPDDLFREAKTRAVQQGTTLKSLMTQFIRSGLREQSSSDVPPLRRNPPPVAIRRVPGQAPARAMSNRELHELLENNEVEACQSKGK